MLIRSNSSSSSEHVRLHRQGHRPAGRVAHAAQQLEGAPAALVLDIAARHHLLALPLTTQFACSRALSVQVQERQNRVCTTVAIAIVAETCAPFTVLPALVNEYRVPENNVQNGVLKVEFGRGGAQAHACRHIDIISYTYTDILFTYAQQVHTTLMCTHTI